LEEISERFDIRDERTIVLSPASNSRTREITLSNDELEKFYSSYIALLSKPVYSFVQSKNIQEKLINNKEKFVNLSIYGKCVLIMKLLDYLKCNERKTVDLSLIGGEKNC
jgi:hypothetical protein